MMQKKKRVGISMAVKLCEFECITHCFRPHGLSTQADFLREGRKPKPRKDQIIRQNDNQSLTVLSDVLEVW